MTQQKDKPILVYRFSALGDIAMTIPVLRSFFKSYPNQKIIFVSKNYAKPLFDEFNNLEFIGVDFNENYNHWIFDLDNTIYDFNLGLFRRVSLRMTEYIKVFFDLNEVSLSINNLLSNFFAIAKVDAYIKS